MSYTKRFLQIEGWGGPDANEDDAAPTAADIRRASRPLKLEVELVPRPTWGQSCNRLMKRSAWKELRQSVCARQDHKCGVCGAGGTLYCHEVWHYDDRTHVQTLTAFIAVCSLCNFVKHVGRAEQLAQAGIVDMNRVIAHFQSVNGCGRGVWEAHKRRAFEVFRERSKHKWRIDWNDMVDPWDGRETKPRRTPATTRARRK